MAVTLSVPVDSPYPRLSLYNSPYDAHDRGCAVDLYPASNTAPSPVAGEVVDTRTVTAPEQPYAVEHDHLILIDVDRSRSPVERPDGDGLVARVLHVDPAVEPGDTVGVGDSIGEMIRSGFFAPWVDNHLHLGFRDPDANPYRAAGSLPLSLDADVRPLDWDGTGRVVESAETYVVLDAPVHPEPDTYYAGVGADDGGVLDGGLPHYTGGGLLAGGGDGSVSLFGDSVGVADGRTVAWDDVTVSANGDPVTGLSLFFGRDRTGAKLVCPDADFAAGDRVCVTVTNRH
ncbi:hypothetical protein [Halostella salina]|uniref:hypothetical protein n=1 Tax=Halostella salina TaxID=1547897 RepID=UPI000EF81848|nr:hypothetical protein [Halostella salina]